MSAGEDSEHKGADADLSEKKRFQFEDIFNSSFTPQYTNLVWVENGSTNMTKLNELITHAMRQTLETASIPTEIPYQTTFS